MVDVVLGEETVGREVRLECRCTEAAVRQELVLVGIDEVGLGMLAQIRGHRIERMRPEHIVVVDEADELSCRELER